MKKYIRIIIIGVLIILSLSTFTGQNIETAPDGTLIKKEIKSKKEINLNEFIEKYKQNYFQEIQLINDTQLHWLKKIEEKQLPHTSIIKAPEKIIYYEDFYTYKPASLSIEDLWISLTGSIPIIVKYETQWLWSKLLLESILPIILFILIFFLFLRMMSPKGWWPFPFGASAGKLQTKEQVKTTFKDVAWMEEAKHELQEIVDYLKNPEKYKKAGARVPKWVLLYWPPGSGKTLLARAVAWEAWVPFFSASGSEFMEMLVGMWAAKVRELFKKAKAAAPSIIFIDEIDTIGKKRWIGHTGWHQEQEQTLNQILTEMDGFDKDTNVIVIAATNRPDILDPALLRPWRFDRKVYVWRPTLEERLQILKIHTKDKKLAPDVDLESLARRTSGMVGADLENIINEAALKAARENRDYITNDDLEYALEKVIMWPEKKIKSIKEKERKIIAYHELWHAVTAHQLPNTDPVEKISIVSRGLALWVTWMMPEEDRYLYSKAKFLDELVSILGGRAAEEIFFGKDEITTGAANDFEKATKIASDMIMKYWMDEELWPVMYFDKDKGEWLPFKPFSEKTNEIIDKKVKELLKNAYEKAKKIIKDNKEKIEILAKVLLEKEYLTKEEFETIMKDPSKAEEILNQFKSSKKENKSSVLPENKNKKEDPKTNEKKEEKEKIKKWLENWLKGKNK